MSLASTNPVEVLRAVRTCANARPAIDEDFVAPSGDDVCAFELAAPGVVHPAHVDWVAECIGRPPAFIDAVLAGGDDESVAMLADALASASTPQRLQALGVRPDELMLRRLPIAAGSQRPNRVPKAGGTAVLSNQNAAWQKLRWEDTRLRRLVERNGPRIIIDAQSVAVQSAFRRLLHEIRGLGPLWVPQYTPNTSPPTSEALVVLPHGCQGFGDQPFRANEVALSSKVVLRFQQALVVVDPMTGNFTTQPFSGARVAAVDEHQVFFCDGSRLQVLDLERGQFVEDARVLPPRVVLGACCGVSILDVPSRTETVLPGCHSSSGHEVTTSPCGQFGWVNLVPSADELGIFSLGEVARAFNVWPHARIGVPSTEDETGEGHDASPRALVRWGDGFRLVYNRHVLEGPRAHELPTVPEAVGFDLTGTRLATVDGRHLTLFDLGDTAEPRKVAQWSLDALRPHLSFNGLDFDVLTFGASSLLGAVGTIGALAAMSVEALHERLCERERPEVLERIIAKAKAVELPTKLR